MSQIKLIVGLANPGAKYEETRHNAGEWLVNELARMFNVTLKEEAKYFGKVAKINTPQGEVRLLVPTTFMNLSGKAVSALANFYRIKPEEILVAHDELDLPPGVAKIKQGGGHGGHNGLKDIIANLTQAEQYIQNKRSEIADILQLTFKQCELYQAKEKNHLSHQLPFKDFLTLHLRNAITQSLRKYDGGLVALASIGAVAPFIGLFGTVWGIFNALMDISQQGQVSIATVSAL